MSTDPHAQVILLLMARLSKSTAAEDKPLTPGEWGRLEAWFEERGRRPEELLESGDPVGFLEGWEDAKITKERIFNLLGAGPRLVWCWRSGRVPGSGC